MKLIIKTAIFILFPLFLSYPQELNGPTPWEVIGNLYSQPNIHMQVGRKALDWYGSGDVNNDEVIDDKDKNAILGANSDRADVDWDGNPGTSDDKALLTQFLNGQIDYLPGHWNKLRTEQERDSLIEKALKIQDTSPYIGEPGYVCSRHINQMYIEFHGISNPEGFNEYEGFEYDLSKNARFNLPFMPFITLNINGEGHAAGGFLTGDGNSSSTDFSNFDKWRFVNYYEDDELYPGEFDMNENGPVILYRKVYAPLRNNPSINIFQGPELINFTLQNGQAINETHKDYVIHDNPNDDVVNVSQLEDIVVDAGSFPEDYVFDVNSLYQLGYTEVIPEVTTENTPLSPEIDYYYPPDTVYTGGDNYSFKIKVVAKIESGGIINADSTEYWIHIDFTTDVEGENRPTKFKLYQNYPNPFNPSTTIEYSLPSDSFVELVVFDITGREIKKLVNKTQKAGWHNIVFSGLNLSSGVYYLKLQTFGFTSIKKMILLK